MFETISKKKADVISHWYALIPGFTTPSKDFYDSIEAELKARSVPGLEVSKVEFAEGGPLSQNRQYLRMCRERLVFDVCAAPFGTGFFFSCRFAEIPIVINLLGAFLSMAFLFGLTMMGWYVSTRVFSFMGLVGFPIFMICVLVGGIYLMRNAVALGLKDLDAALIKSPLLGGIYEAWFRKETYYRHDTRLMYCDTVNDVVKAKVEEVTGAKGIKLVKFMELTPVMAEMYLPREVTLPRNTPDTPCQS